jgi:hypothetical protein
VAERVPAKRFLDIETALRWAYRDELPKRQHASSIGAISPGFRRLPDDDERRANLSKWQIEPGHPPALGELHPDALLIEASVKGLDAWFGHGFGPDPTAAGLMHGMEHLELDHLQAGVEAVAAMPGIVAVHARAGTRPSWPRELPQPFPDRGGNGKPVVLMDETFVETIDRHGRVRYEPSRNPPPRRDHLCLNGRQPAGSQGRPPRRQLLPASLPAGAGASSPTAPNTPPGGWGWSSCTKS